MPTGSVMPSNYLIFCRPLLLPPSIFPSPRPAPPGLAPPLPRSLRVPSRSGDPREHNWDRPPPKAIGISTHAARVYPVPGALPARFQPQCPPPRAQLGRLLASQLQLCRPHAFLSPRPAIALPPALAPLPLLCARLPNSWFFLCAAARGQVELEHWGSCLPPDTPRAS